MRTASKKSVAWRRRHLFRVQEPANGEERADDDADNGVDAHKLLRALAREDPEVADRVRSLEPDVAAQVAEPKPSRCAIM